jgi:hypothetical protein
VASKEDKMKRPIPSGAKANDYQVGGDHYKSSYQHWDWAPECGLDYLSGTATKYLCRWKQKGGIEDLEKGLHYAIKLTEESRVVTRKFIHNRPEAEKICKATYKVCAGYGMSVIEMDIMLSLAMWKTSHDLRRVVDLYTSYVESQKPAPATDETSKLTEENHHAQREGQAYDDYYLAEGGEEPKVKAAKKRASFLEDDEDEDDL